MGTRFQEITRSMESLAAVLASIPTTDAPWDTAFEQTFCANCSLENCDNCRYKNVDRIVWWLKRETKEPILTEKKEAAGWFSKAEKQELVDKLGPIEHQAEELFEILCDRYCRYTSAASGKTQDELLDICEGCPLSRLGDLIGV